MLYCFADHVALPSSFSDTSKTNLGCCHARTQKRYAQQQQQLKRDEWRARPDESLSMHVQVDGIEFNHRNDRPFFFLFFFFLVGAVAGMGGGTGQATWMVCGDEGLDDWCPRRKSQWICGRRWKKSCLVINWSVWRIQEAQHFPQILPLLILFTTWLLFEGAHTAPLIQLKWSYLSHVPVIVGRQCCWIRHLSKAQSCSRCSSSCLWSEIQYTL